ncbi:MAG: integrase arm-type DNA-binding domain-containing protein, partial [Allopontixanthobacter sediminis]
TWRFKFRFEKKELLLVIGSYPETSLAKAREKRGEARKLLSAGRDPRHAFYRARLVGDADQSKTFEYLARDWYNLQLDRWKPVHANDVITSLERDIFPSLGRMPLEEIDEPLLLVVLRKVEKRGAIETAQRLKQRVNAVFLHARGLGIKADNPAVHIGKSLKPVPPSRRYPAIVTANGLREFLSEVDSAKASPITRLAARFLALTCQRPGMVRHLEWADLKGIDWGNAEADSPEALWVVPSQKMKQELKLREDDAFNHMVPLTPRAVETLRAVRWLTGRALYAFPNSLSGLKPMSENAIGYLYNRQGYKGKHVPHGWRSSFSTIMNEKAERALGQDSRLLGAAHALRRADRANIADGSRKNMAISESNGAPIVHTLFHVGKRFRDSEGLAVAKPSSHSVTWFYSAGSAAIEDASAATAIGALTCIGAGSIAEIARTTSSSMKAGTSPPIGRTALVPEMKKPAIGTKAIAPTTPAVPVTPLSSNGPESRIWRPLTRTNNARASSLPDLPHMPLLRTLVTSPSAIEPAGITVTLFTTTGAATSIRMRCPTRAAFSLVVISSSRRSVMGVPARSIA